MFWCPPMSRRLVLPRSFSGYSCMMVATHLTPLNTCRYFLLGFIGFIIKEELSSLSYGVTLCKNRCCSGYIYEWLWVAEILWARENGVVLWGCTAMFSLDSQTLMSVRRGRQSASRNHIAGMKSEATTAAVSQMFLSSIGWLVSLKWIMQNVMVRTSNTLH